ncbi:MAG: hypothetical protein A2W64_00380 [Candidatus Zambryskibacteria bacterium RIFCSPLOWO2_02_39_10]|nr:MAG: hypothetical protein A2W64_00380 [Candidatus Zambryskibacteria bacterium RIFCSPLOWO2_02_39_10]
MNQDLFFDNKKYISVKEASSLTGYSKDYIGQLCRGNKVDSKRIGRVWYVTHDSILSHKNSGAKIEQVAEPSLKESRTDEIEKTIEPKDISADFSPTLPLSSFSLLPKQVAVFVLGLVLTTGAVLLKDDILASESSLPSLVNLQNLSKNISSAPNDFYQAMREVSDFYSKELGSRYISWGENLRKTSFSFGEEFYTAFQNPPLYIKEKIVRLSLAERKLVRENFSAASYFTNLEDYGHLDGAGLAVYNGVNNFFNNFVYSRLASFFKTPEIVANEIIPLAKNSSTLGELGVPPAPSVGKGRSPTLGVTNNVIQKVIERIIEKPIAGFLTQASLDTQLEILSNKLLSQMTVQFSGLSTGRGGSITNVYQQIAQSQKIDNLYNTTLANATITSGSISGVSLSATTGSFGSNVSVGGNFSVTGANTTLTNLTITGTTSSQSATTTILFADTFTGYTTRVTNLTATGTVAFPNISINSLLSTNANGQLSATSTPTFGHFNATSTVATSTIATGGLVVGASQFIIQQSSGRIGIGTTSPTANIEILQTGNGNTILSAYRVTDTNPSGDFINYKTKAGTTLFRVDNSGNLLAGGIINSGSQTITSVSTPQFRVQYDSSNEWTASTNAVGSTTFATNGANSSLNFIPQNNQTQAFTFQNAAGTNIFNIDTTNGRIGIGSTTPGYRLSVAGSGFFDGGTVTASVFTATSTLSVTGATTLTGLLSFVNASGTQLTTTNSTYLATTGGNVGIGTTSPTFKLDVMGNAYFSGTGYFGGAITGTSTLSVEGNTTLGNATTTDVVNINSRLSSSLFPTSDNLLDFGDSSNWLRWRTGYFGTSIGIAGTATSTGTQLTTSGNYLLDTAGTLSLNTTNNSAINLGTGLLSLTRATTTNITATGSAYFATASGNVGIGTVGPGYKLEVVSAATTPAAATFRTSGFADYNVSTVYLQDDTAQAAGVGGRLAFRGLNDVGAYTSFGTIQGAKLNGTAGNNAGVLIFSTQVNGGSVTEKMRIDNLGNVGIGTTSPWRVLSTVGTVGFSSTLSTESGSDNYLCMDPITFEVTDGGATCGASSQRYKENISPIAYGLADVLKLNPVSYTYKPNINPDGELKLGFIAEEMFTILPEIVELNSDGLPESVDYAKLTAVLTKAMQEQASGFVVNFDQNAQNIPISGTSTAHMAIMGHCVTGDTLLPIRRRKKRKQGDEESDEEKDWEYLMMPIKNILVGDEVLSLNKDNGQVEYHTIKGLMDMGVKKVYKLTTVSGRVIRTTSTHPYLVASVPKFDSKTSPIIVLKMMTRKLTGVIKNVSEYITNSILPPKISETRAILTGQGRDTKTENLLGAGGKFNTLPSSPSMGSNSDFKTQGELGVPPAPGVGNAIQKENASLTKDAFSSMLYSTTRNSTGTGMLESIANDNELSMSISVDNLVKPSEGIEPSEHGIPVPVLHQADGIDLLYHQTDTEDNGNGTETTPIRNSRAADICPYCLTKDFVKRGTRKNKNQVVQLYLCRNFGCGRTFTAQDVKGKHFPLHIVIESMSYYNLGFTLEDTCRIIKKKFGVAPEPATLSDWINEYKSLCRYERLRPYAIKMFRPKDMVEVTTMAHRQLYRFRYHRAKTILMLDEFKNRALTPLKDYLDNITAETPHQYFQDGERMSEIRSKFDKADMIVKSKFNYANRLTAFVLQSIPENKERHEILQRFMIANDSCTVATEVPVYIRREDVEHLENELKFNIAGPEGVEFKKRKGDELPKGKATSASGRRFPKLLTGHIDFVQIRNGCIHILDYKPNASKEKPIEQLTWYALALSRLTGLRIFNFVCAWFDEKDYFQFYPLHVVKKLSGKKRRIVHYRSGEVAEVPRVNELTVIPRSTSPPQDTS